MLDDIPHCNCVKLLSAEFFLRVECGKGCAHGGNAKRFFDVQNGVFGNVSSVRLPAALLRCRQKRPVGAADVQHRRFFAACRFEYRIHLSDAPRRLRLYRRKVFKIGATVLVFVLFCKIRLCIFFCRSVRCPRHIDHTAVCAPAERPQRCPCDNVVRLFFFRPADGTGQAF